MAEISPWQNDIRIYDETQKQLYSYLLQVVKHGPDVYEKHTATRCTTDMRQKLEKFEDYETGHLSRADNVRLAQDVHDASNALLKNYKTHFDQIKDMHYQSDIEAEIHRCIDEGKHFYIGYTGKAGTYLWKTEPKAKPENHENRWTQLNRRTGRYPLKLKTYFYKQTDTVNEKKLVKKFYKESLCLNGTMDTEEEGGYVYVLVYQAPQFKRVLCEVLPVLDDCLQQYFQGAREGTLHDQRTSVDAMLVQVYQGLLPVPLPHSTLMTAVDVLLRSIALRETCSQVDSMDPKVEIMLVELQEAVTILQGEVASLELQQDLEPPTFKLKQPEHVKKRQKVSEGRVTGILENVKQILHHLTESVQSCSDVDFQLTGDSKFLTEVANLNQAVSALYQKEKPIFDLENLSMVLQETAFILKTNVVLLQEHTFELMDAALVCNQLRSKGTKYLYTNPAQRKKKEEFEEENKKVDEDYEARRQKCEDVMEVVRQQLQEFKNGVDAATQQHRKPAPTTAADTDEGNDGLPDLMDELQLSD